MSGGIVEVNKVCDLCNCYIGAPGHRVCDVELASKYGRPRIPPQCPKGYPVTSNLSRKNIKGKLTTRKIMERIERVELERKIVAELTKNGRMRLENLAESIQTRELDKLRNMLMALKRRGVVRKANGRRTVKNRGGWRIRRGVGEVAESNRGVGI